MRQSLIVCWTKLFAAKGEYSLAALFEAIAIRCLKTVTARENVYASFNHLALFLFFKNSVGETENEKIQALTSIDIFADKKTLVSSLKELVLGVRVRKGKKPHLWINLLIQSAPKKLISYLWKNFCLDFCFTCESLTEEAAKHAKAKRLSCIATGLNFFASAVSSDKL